MAKSGVLSPLVLKAPKKNGHTAPQVSQTPLFDSRLQKRQVSTTLTPTRIRQLRRDPTISMMRDIVLAPVVHTEWTVIASEEAPEGAKELIEKTIFPLRLDFLQRSFFGCIDFGWAPFEKVIEEKDGEFVITKIKGLIQDYTWIMVYVDTGEFAGFINYPLEFGKSLEEVYINPDESINITFEVEGTDWYGISIFEDLESTDDDWIDSNNSSKRYNTKVAGAHWVVSFPVGETKYNGTLTDNQDIAINIINTLESNGAVAVPDDIMEFIDDVDNETRGKWKVELLSDSSNTQTTFTDRQKYLDTLKVRAFGIPERSVLEGQFGTKAEAEVHADMGLATIDTKHRQVVRQLNEQAVRQIMRLNYGEEVQDTVKIQVAPLVDSRFAVLKESFRLLMQSPNTIDDIMPRLNLSAMMEELSLPALTEEEAEKKMEERMQRKLETAQVAFGGNNNSEEDGDGEEKPFPPGQNPKQKEENDADKA